MGNNPQLIRSVQRAIDIIKCVGENGSEITLTEISNGVGLAKSTTTRLLDTLEANDFLERNIVTGKYRLGRQLYFLGHEAGRSMEVKEVSRDAMLRLRDQFRETVNLYVLDGEHRVCIQQFESLQSVKHMIQIGQKLPLTVGASGKVLLAYQPKSFIESIMKEQPMVKSQTYLQDELNQIIEKKYAVSIEEREAGTSAAAAPVFNVKGEMVAALSISGPANRFNPNNITDLQPVLVAYALEISTNMGFNYK